MKNRILWCIILTLLPLLAFGLAAMPDSVTVVLSESEVTAISFFDTLPDGSRPLGLAFAGLLCLAVAVEAAAYGITKREFWLSGAIGSSLGAAILAVLPLILRTEPLTIPNAGVAILLCAESLLGYFYKHKATRNAAEEKAAGNRLKR